MRNLLKNLERQKIVEVHGHLRLQRWNLEGKINSFSLRLLTRLKCIVYLSCVNYSFPRFSLHWFFEIRHSLAGLQRSFNTLLKLYKICLSNLRCTYFSLPHIFCKSYRVKLNMSLTNHRQAQNISFVIATLIIPLLFLHIIGLSIFSSQNNSNEHSIGVDLAYLLRCML